MKSYIVPHEWKIIEDQYRPAYNQISESLLSLGNGKMGQRANFEETYTGESLQGSYIAGVYYPDKTRVGWWKNGYPEYFAKVLNSCNWIGIMVEIDGEFLDLAKAKVVHEFYRELDMKNGLLYRKMKITMQNGNQIEIESKRITSMADDELGVISYSITSHNYEGIVAITPFLDFDITNMDSNYDESFWSEKEQNTINETAFVSALTKKTNYEVGVAMTNKIYLNGVLHSVVPQHSILPKQAFSTYEIEVTQNDKVTLEKFVGISSSLNYSTSEIKTSAIKTAEDAGKKRFDEHLQNHVEAWATIWDMCDITIKEDVSAQQAIRFNIFQLYQTYSGKDDRLNIGPKGFTGEKYGGSTYWDTEAYCLPFYLSTANQEVAKNLLIYRYKQLGKAIENAEKLGFGCGAALYPMVTMTGEECHNEWEITFEEIHRNGAIAYAIFDYIRYTDDKDYLAQYGLEVLVAIARFWAQRVNWSEARNKYVMLGVTGPNEYENNVNNNWYTNYIASWCLQYAMNSVDFVKTHHSALYPDLVKKMNFSEKEMTNWKEIVDQMYYPTDAEKGIFLQQDNYLDKEQILVSNLGQEHRPINQKWSWDRILRSCFIKQADVLQGLYFFEEDFDMDTHKANFEFYEPRTVHESSLSPCVHGILASKLGMHEKAYEMYLRTARLDLDDYNNDTEDGCHITSMAGTWLAIVKGFGGMRIENHQASFRPSLPQNWKELNFKIKFRKNLFEVNISKEKTTIKNLSGPQTTVLVDGKTLTLLQSN